MADKPRPLTSRAPAGTPASDARIAATATTAATVPARDRVNALLDRRDARRAVRSLDAESLYSLIVEAGLEDAYELVLLAAPEQVQAIVDFDCWRRDEFQLDRFSTWLAVVLQGDDDDFAALYGEADIEAFVLWLRESTAVFDWEEDHEFLNEVDNPILTSPCGQYAVVLPDEDVDAQLIRLFLERMYGMDVEQALRVMFAARYEVTSDLQEQMFRLRTSRLADLGYVPFDEAVAVFAWLPPSEWAQRQRRRLAEADTSLEAVRVGSLPPLEQHVVMLREHVASSEAGRFAQALAAVRRVLDGVAVDEVMESVMAQLRALVNRAHVAELGNPGDLPEARRHARAVFHRLDLALELLAGDDLTLAARAVAYVPLVELHRAGYSVTLQLQRQARELARRGNLTLTEAPASLLVAEDIELVDGLLALRPVQHAGRGTPFTSLADVQRVAERLGQIAFAELLFFAWLRMDREALAAVVYDGALNVTPAEQVTFRMLFATLLLNQTLDAERALTPLTLEELSAALGALRAQGNPLVELTDLGRRFIEAHRPPEHRLDRFALGFAAECAAWLADETGDLAVDGSGRPAVTLELATSWVLVHP